MSKDIGGTIDWKIVSASFEAVAGESGTMKISDIKTDATPVAKANMDNAPQILVQAAGGGYDRYYYLSDALDDDAFQAALAQNQDYVEAKAKLDEAEAAGDDDAIDEWGAIVDDIEFETKPAYKGIGWAGDNGNLTKVTISLGTSYWYTNPSKTDSVTFSGQVPSATSIDLDALSGWTLICNPYPTTATFEGILWTGIVPVTKANMDNGPQILVQAVGGGYDRYYYLSDALDDDAFQAALAQNQDYVEAKAKLDEAEAAGDDDAIDEWGAIVDDIEFETKPAYKKTGWAGDNGNLVSGAIVNAGFGFWLMIPDKADPVTATFAHP